MHKFLEIVLEVFYKIFIEPITELEHILSSEEDEEIDTYECK